MNQNSPKLVRDLMTVGVLTCAPDTPLADLARLLLDKSCEAVVVMQDGHALGVVGEDELVGAFEREAPEGLLAEDVLREGVPQVPPDIPLRSAAQLMHDLGVRTLFLMHHSGGVEYPAAQISYRHLLRLLAAQDEAELRDLGMHAERQSPLEAFIQRRDAARRDAARKKVGRDAS
jgi:CBS domain-containing protein